MNQTSVLFLCLGNICRSPLAEGVFRAEVTRRGLAGEVRVDSAGTGAWHVGEPPDPRSVAVARDNGVDISQQSARRLVVEDFERFDWIVAMDGDNLRTARERQPKGAHARLVPFMDYVPNAPGRDVPDPYYGGQQGFAHVYALLAAGAGPLLDAVIAARGA
ncbi:MAG: low molecular weight phosphotyrosine protein phosphatase [Deltaproteobacteria bacterium HGW-Deltaproteobacteria-14]|jgi:protein-tyrosine phosphatase|nr:MAG: low molecular weight phosphotyrosine protein phosphatase [Deltaproteobacteria bacterium HGW-Deltaproteobacteria-14]